MLEISNEQIRNFRLRSHHLDRFYSKQNIIEAAGACGLQNTPPGAWEIALHHRIKDCTLTDLENHLYVKKDLLQAWSYRGAPVIFPATESDVFLSALVPEGDEPWIYTHGIFGALDFLQMSFNPLLDMVKQVITYLDSSTIKSKSTLDKTLAELVMPLLPSEKKELWCKPSMYGNPDKQTVGEAVVSFMLRPCSFCGLIVFGERLGRSPSFTSYSNWTGQTFQPNKHASKELVRKFLHCYGPATVESFAKWLGCSKQQAQRMWTSVREEIEPVVACGKVKSILSADREKITAFDPNERKLILLGGHDSYLDQRDREIILEDKSLHQMVWKTTTNPGVIIKEGKIIGIWTSRKQKNKINMQLKLWEDISEQEKSQISNLAEEFAAFQQCVLANINMQF